MISFGYNKSTMNKYIFLILAVLLIVAIGWFVITKSDKESALPADVYVLGEPFDLTLEIVGEWRENVSTTSEAQISLDEFVKKDIFSQTIRQKLVDTAADTAREPLLDVMFCQAETPPRLVGRVVFETPNEAQVMVLARGQEEPSGYQAIVSLKSNGEGAWSITDIDCVQGEVAPVVEFAFDKNGYLLKSVPPPYQTGEWHVTFSQEDSNGNVVSGYVAPLFFTEESICIAENGEESICNPDSLVEPVSALVQGDMSEVGVTVRRITFN